MINIAGIVSVILFYLLILGVGMWAARKKGGGEEATEEVSFFNVEDAMYTRCLLKLA